MRSYLPLLFSIFTLFAAWGQSAPQGFNYQSVVRNSDGTAYSNQTVSLLFNVRSGAANGPVIYAERQTVNTNEFGLVNLVVGRGEVLQGSFASINWGGGPKFLSTLVETSPGVYDELGATELLSVPYALFAQNGGGSTGGNDNWGTQSAQTDLTLKGDGTGGNPLGISQQGAAVGQVLKWDGNRWVPQDDISNTSSAGGTVTQVNTGAGLSGGPITTNGTITLSNTGVTPGTYGSATQIPVISIDAQGRISSVFTAVPSPGTIGINGGGGIAVQQNGYNFTITNTGDLNPADDLTAASQAGGDLSGPFSNLQIKADAVGSGELANGAVTASKLSNMGAASGQILKWNGSAWAPAADNGGTLNVSGGGGIAVSGTAPNFTITNTGDTNASDDVTTASLAGGDLSGTFANLQIKPDVITSNEIAAGAVGIAEIADQSVTAPKLSPMGATSGQVLKWNGSAWAPAADNGGTLNVSAGSGITLSGTAPNFTIINTGDTNASDDITTASQAGGDLSGTFANLQIKADAVTSNEIASGAIGIAEIADESVTAPKLSPMGATLGQVLKWNGSAWAPAIDNTGSAATTTITAGAGIAVTANGANYTITNSGDSNGSDDVRITDQAGGDLTGTFSNLDIKPGVITNTEIASNTVNSANIMNGTITAADLSNMSATLGQVLAWNGLTWAPVTPSGGSGGIQTTAPLTGTGSAASPVALSIQGVTTGQVLKFNGATWAPAAEAGPDSWGTQAAATNATLSGNGTAGNPLQIATQGATNGQVLKFNGSTWAPAADNGDNWGTQAATVGSALTGNGTSASPLNLAQQGAVSGQVLTWNGSAWIPSTVSGGGSGDNWGTQNVITSTVLSGNGTAGSPLTLANQGASFGQTLKWDGFQWSPADDIQGSGSGTGNTYAPGNGISITGIAPNFTINNTGDVSATNELQTLSLSGNALTLSNGGGSVTIDASPTDELQSLSLSGNTLSLSNGGGNVTLPTTPAYTAGTGISISGQTIANTGDLSNTNELQTISLAGNTLSLSNGGGNVSLPTTPAYTAGTGISISGQTVTNTGDISNTNELQTLALNGTELTLSGTNDVVDLATLISGNIPPYWKLGSNGTDLFNTNTGFVGVNEEAPKAQLHIKGSNDNVLRVQSANPKINLYGGTSLLGSSIGLQGKLLVLSNLDTSGIRIQTAAPGISIEGEKGNVMIGGNTPGLEKLKIIHGDRGFALQNGATGPSWEFHVTSASGNLSLYNSLAGPGVPVGIFSQNGTYTSSDRRLKRDIQALPATLSKINQLAPVSYQFNYQSSDAPRSVGLIAQEVQAVFPELVMENPVREGEGSTLLVNYGGLSVLTIKAIQEQQQQIERLNQENAALRARLDAIEARLKEK